MGLLSARPSGSVIESRDDWDGLTLFWPLPIGGPQRHFAAAFLAFWLCGWAFGLAAMTRSLLTGGFQPFVIVWLGGWTVGGGFAIWTLWNMLRPSRPESVTMGVAELRYDPGAAPGFDPYRQAGWWDRSANQHGWHGQATRRRPMTVPKDEIGKFVLDRAGERQRLSFDRGADRVEIGACLREPEREWLHAVLEDWRRASHQASPWE